MEGYKFFSCTFFLHLPQNAEINHCTKYRPESGRFFIAKNIMYSLHKV